MNFKHLHFKIALFAFPFLPCALFTLFAGTASQAASNGQDDYSRFAKVESIACDFRMERHSAISEKPLVSTGRFYFRRPGFLRWEYRMPLAHGFLLNGSNAWSWQDEAGKRTVKNISSQPMARMMGEQLAMFLSMDMERIGKKFKIEPFANGIDLIPLNLSDSRQTLAKIRLIFARNNVPAVTETVISEKAGGKTVIHYQTPQLNQPFPEGIEKP